ncbi:chloroperoxidase-like protein [Diaporthe amygdali]|uniref:chloroperoxidase-like protein n=1 Tax=Phomopsis amygdali TaxID=1214568 RepID=UPI0022FEF9FD|nr:chloroperoxidase-like protein [Diaporthe amygdali]KAJ0118133.1 chloroperoxidase-like protein [Diaporthe amygdali]
MHTFSFIRPLLSGLFLSCRASASDPHKYIPPTASDSRSPCPGLNALANQGYIPRDGRNIDPAQLKEAMIEVMNLQIEPFDTEIQVTLDHSTTGNSSTFNLEDSNVHNNIEIDGSLSRKDLYFGDNIHFDQAIWDQSSSKFEGDIITIRTAAESRAYRTMMAEKVNPNFTANPFIAGLAPAIYMLVFGGVNATETQRDWIESFFRDRLPTHLGWTKSPVELTKDNLFAMSSTIAAVPVATAMP